MPLATPEAASNRRHITADGLTANQTNVVRAMCGQGIEADDRDDVIAQEFLPAWQERTVCPRCFIRAKAERQKLPTVEKAVRDVTERDAERLAAYDRLMEEVGRWTSQLQVRAVLGKPPPARANATKYMPTTLDAMAAKLRAAREVAR
jgi:hypothetical protein